jgi:hypothetical protein
MPNEIKEYYSTVTGDRGIYYPEEAAALFDTLKEVPSKRLADADPIKEGNDPDGEQVITIELEPAKPAAKTTKDND